MRRFALLCLLALALPIGLLAQNEYRQEAIRKELRQKEIEEFGLLEQLDRMNERASRALTEYSQTKSSIQAMEATIKANEQAVINLKLQIKDDAKILQKKLHALYITRQVRKMTPFPGLASMNRYLVNAELLKGSVDIDAESLTLYTENIKNLKQITRDLKEQRGTLTSLLQQRQNRAEALQYELKAQKKYLTRMRQDSQTKRRYLKEIEAQGRGLDKLTEDTQKGPFPASSGLDAVKSAGFRGLEKSLPAPLSGRLYQAYGQSKNPLFQEGVLFASKSGETAKAVLGGKIVFAGPFRGMGKMVMIDHGKGSFSLYGNLKSTAVKRGQEVGKGTDLGEPMLEAQIGEPLLYFETRYRKRKVDPAKWLKPGEIQR